MFKGKGRIVSSDEIQLSSGQITHDSDKYEIFFKPN
jgi:hypothetical protein